MPIRRRGGAGGSGSGLALGPKTNEFADVATRDAYATANADWLAQYNGDRSFWIRVAGTDIQRRNVAGTAWEDVTAVVQGPAGLDGAAVANAQIQMVVDAAGHLVAASDLSDVADAGTARGNLGALSQSEVDTRASERYTDDEKTKLQNIAANATAVTIAQVLAKVFPGDNVTVDDSVAGQITINATGGGGLTSAQVIQLISMANIGDAQIAATIARDSEVSAAIAAVRDGVAAAYDTLAELAAAIPDLSSYRTSTQINSIFDQRLAQAINDGTQTNIEVTFTGGQLSFTVAGSGGDGLTEEEVQALIDAIHVIDTTEAEDGISTTPGLISAIDIAAAVNAHAPPPDIEFGVPDFDTPLIGSGDVDSQGTVFAAAANSPEIDVPSGLDLAFINFGAATNTDYENGEWFPISLGRLKIKAAADHLDLASAANSIKFNRAIDNGNTHVFVGYKEVGEGQQFLFATSSSSDDILPVRIAQLRAPATIGMPTISDHARYAVVLTADRTPTAADLADAITYSTSSDTNQITLPVFTENSYLWFLDRADQPDLTTIQQIGSPFNQVGSFLKLGATLTVGDDEYSLWEHADDQGEAEQVYPGPNSGTTWRLE